MLAVALVLVFVAAWYRSRKKRKASYVLPPAYAATRARVWPEYSRIYLHMAVRWDVILILKDAKDMPAGHAAAAYRLNTDFVTVNREGYKGFSPQRWFAAELHNVFRNRIGLPYGAADEEDGARAIEATAVWKEIP
jgi:hypothetical protein